MVGKTIQSMNQRHFHILNLRYKDWGVQQIATHLNMSRRQVSLIVNSASFRHEIAIKRAQNDEREEVKGSKEEDEVLQTLKNSTKAAVDKLCSHLKSPDDKTSMKASLEILDRTGYTKKEEQKQQATVAIIINHKDSDIIRETIDMLNHNESTETVNASSDLPPVNSNQTNP